MTIPPYLKPGDLVGVTCPASKMDREAALFAASVVENWGYRVRVGRTAGSAFHNFSAPDAIRLEELQRMLDDEEVKAILFGRGGYGLVRILDALDFTRFRAQPKWICGYSDITALHLHIHAAFRIATLHSVMCSGITPSTSADPYVESLHRALAGDVLDYRFASHPLDRPGVAEGELIGGNLSLLANISGTVSQPDTTGKILFVEDVGEYRYAVDRMMLNLRRAGWLKGLAGLVVGSFTAQQETDTPFGQSDQELILDKVIEEDFPVAFGFPVGHSPRNYALKEGLRYRLVVDGTPRLTEWPRAADSLYYSPAADQLDP